MGLLDRRFVLCAVVLVVNDRVLKAEFGNWVTGKLSDFAGVVVFAVVVAQALHWLGVSATSSRRIGVVASGVSLVVVKLHAGSAAFVEATAAHLGVSYEIVVDPTDLIALAALPIAAAIMRDPRDLVDRPSLRRLVFVVACVACAASGFDAGAGYDFVERTEGGSIVVGRREAGVEHAPVTPVLETATPTRWRTDPDVGDINWTLTRQSCSPVDPTVCIELGPGSRVAVSEDSGETYEVEWEVDDGGWWQPTGDPLTSGYPFLYSANDLAWSDDGLAFIAMSDRYPVVRNVDGSFTPSIADLHPYPWPTVVYVLLGWLVVSAGLRLASERESGRGGIAFGLAAGLLMLGAVLFGSTFGPVFAVLLAPVPLVLLIIALLLVFRGKPVEPAQFRFVNVPMAKLLWPFPAFAVLGLLWDIDLVPWILMLVVMFVVVVGATISAWPARRKVLPPPPQGA